MLTKYITAGPSIFESAIWNFLHVILPRFLENMCALELYIALPETINGE
jgi:hypothetical protein